MKSVENGSGMSVTGAVETQFNRWGIDMLDKTESERKGPGSSTARTEICGYGILFEW